jgi:hypothetical protein
MAHKNKVLSTAGRLQLINSVNERGGRKFLIKLGRGWNSHRTECEELFDPTGSRKVAGADMWKFNTRKEAEELMAVAVLKGYSR